MAKVDVLFYKIIQDSQDYGSDDEYMISRIFFKVFESEKTFEGHADLKQLVGSSFETPGSIEVGAPVAYAGPRLDHNTFAAAAAKCFKDQVVGKESRGIHISGGAKVRMHNNAFEFTSTAKIETHEKDHPSW
jgi:hypothetical protein